MSAASDALNQLATELTELKDSITDAQSVGVAQGTLNNLVELATLRAFSVFEIFLEKVFYICMLGDSSVFNSGSIVPVADRTQAELVLLSSRDKREPYLDWLPLDRTLGLADAYLNEPNAFGWLRYRLVEAKASQELATLRNEVAHGSDQAHVKFLALAAEKHYSVTRAADYLLSVRGGDLEVLIVLTQVEVIARSLLEADEVAASRLLQPEREFQVESKVMPGRYECARCGQGQIMREGGRLSRCPACDPPAACPACGRVEKSSSAWRRIIR